MREAVSLVHRRHRKTAPRTGRESRSRQPKKRFWQVRGWGGGKSEEFSEGTCREWGGADWKNWRSVFFLCPPSRGPSAIRFMRCCEGDPGTPRIISSHSNPIESALWTGTLRFSTAPRRPVEGHFRWAFDGTSMGTCSTWLDGHAHAPSSSFHSLDSERVATTPAGCSIMADALDHFVLHVLVPRGALYVVSSVLRSSDRGRIPFGGTDADVSQRDKTPACQLLPMKRTGRGPLALL